MGCAKSSLQNHILHSGVFGFSCTNKAYFKLSISILVWRLQYYLWIYYSQLHMLDLHRLNMVTMYQF